MNERHTNIFKDKDAIYSVSLKKVRYRSVTSHDYRQGIAESDCDVDAGPSSSNQDGLQWQTVKEMTLMCGTLERIVDELTTQSGELNSRHFNELFATYRAFATSAEILHAILTRYKAVYHDDVDDAGAVVKQRRVNVLESLRAAIAGWIESYPADFYTPMDMFECLVDVMDIAKLYHTQLNDLYTKASKLKSHFKRIEMASIRQNLRFAKRRLHRLKEHSLLFNELSIDDTGDQVLQIIFDSLDKPDFLNELEYASNKLIKPYAFGHPMQSTSDITKCKIHWVAEQLTYWDATLFLQILPYQLQNAFWGKRKKNTDSAEAVKEVSTTIDQFNALSDRVITSILCYDPELTPKSARARVIEHWIEVAYELRILKNFASFKAVLSSLQSTPIYELRGVWALVSTVHLSMFADLARTFHVCMERDNDSYEQGAQMRIMEDEATLKTANLEQRDLNNNSGRRSKLQYKRTKSETHLGQAQSEDCQGTIPYLGPYLTALEYLHAASPDITEENLISFDKRRKEFDIFCKLKLFQSAAQTYKLKMDPRFPEWFQRLPCRPYQECCRISALIEQPGSFEIDDTLHKSMKKRFMPKSQTLCRLFGSPTDSGNDDDQCFDRTSSSGRTRRSPLTSMSFGTWTKRQGSYTLNAMHDLSAGESDGSPSIDSYHFRKNSTSSASESRPIMGVDGLYNQSEFDPTRLISPKGGRVTATIGQPGNTNAIDDEGIQRYGSSHARDRSLSPNATSGKVRAPRIDNYPKAEHMRSRSTANEPLRKTMETTRNLCNSLEAKRLSDTSNARLKVRSRQREDEFYVLRVGLHESLCANGDSTNYKCIKLENDVNVKVRTLISRALDKHMLTYDESKLELVQLKDDYGEFVLPSDCKPYYAVIPPKSPEVPMLNFILRPKNAKNPSQNKDRRGSRQLIHGGKRLFKRFGTQTPNTTAASRLTHWSSAGVLNKV